MEPPGARYVLHVGIGSAHPVPPHKPVTGEHLKVQAVPPDRERVFAQDLARGGSSEGVHACPPYGCSGRTCTRCGMPPACTPALRRTAGCEYLCAPPRLGGCEHGRRNPRAASVDTLLADR